MSDRERVSRVVCDDERGETGRGAKHASLDEVTRTNRLEELLDLTVRVNRFKVKDGVALLGGCVLRLAHLARLDFQNVLQLGDAQHLGVELLPLLGCNLHALQLQIRGHDRLQQKRDLFAIGRLEVVIVIVLTHELVDVNFFRR